MGILIALAVANFQSNFLANRLASAAFKTQRDTPPASRLAAYGCAVATPLGM